MFEWFRRVFRQRTGGEKRTRAGTEAAAAAARAYQSAKSSRLTIGFGGGDSSADLQLQSGLASMRSRSRQLVRDSSYAKRAKTIVQTNVVGHGVGMQAQVRSSRGELNNRINDAIEREWQGWSEADSCHTGGALHFADMELLLIGEIFEAGEILSRKHFSPFGASRIPFALEVVEPERLPDGAPQYPVPGQQGNMRMGIEVDAFYRALAYWLRRGYPNDIAGMIADYGRYLRVPASQMWHLKIVSRWPQTRGEPWMHTVMRKLNDMDGYSEAEIVAARAAANYLAAIESADDPNSPLAGQMQETSGEQITDLEPATALHLGPGEKINFNNPNRPNSAMDPFMRMMLREVAAGVGVSYESISRDYSQTTYSSGRLALLDDRDLWRTLQQWYIRSFRVPLHREWLRSAVLSGAIPEINIDEYMRSPAKFEAVRFKPRGWSWVDPTKEVAAYEMAVRDGFTTVSDVIAKTGDGRDLEDVLDERKKELEMMAQAGLVFDTDPKASTPKAPAPAADSAQPGAQDGAAPQPGRTARLVSLGR